jgi:hypothetical protein
VSSSLVDVWTIRILIPKFQSIQEQINLRCAAKCDFGSLKLRPVIQLAVERDTIVDHNFTVKIVEIEPVVTHELSVQLTHQYSSVLISIL